MPFSCQVSERQKERRAFRPFRIARGVESCQPCKELTTASTVPNHTLPHIQNRPRNQGRTKRLTRDSLSSHGVGARPFVLGVASATHKCMSASAWEHSVDLLSLRVIRWRSPTASALTSLATGRSSPARRRPVTAGTSSTCAAGRLSTMISVVNYCILV